MSEPHDDPDQNSEPSSSRSWKWMKLFGLAAIVIGVLPSIVSVTGTGGRVLSWVHPELEKVTRFEQITMRWWAPIECRGLEVSNTRDWAKDAPPLLTVERIATSRPLWQIAASLGRNVDATVTAPELTLIESPDHSNLTDAIEDLSGTSESGGSIFPCRITVERGRVSVASLPKADSAFEDTHTASGSYTVETLISGIQCNVSTLDTNASLPEVSLIAAIGNQDDSRSSPHGRMAAQGPTMHPRIAARLDDLAADYSPIQIDPVDDAESGATPTIELRLEAADDSSRHAIRFQARGVELETLQPVVAQLSPGVRCRGRLSVRGEGMMLGNVATDGLALRFAMQGADILWQQPTWDSGEALDVRTLDANCGLAIAEDGIVVQTLTAECPFARLSGDGEIRLPTEQLLRTILDRAGNDDKHRSDVISQAQTAAAGQINIDGQVNLVAIAEMLPKTLRLRDGLTLQKGTAQFTMRTRTQPSSEAGSSPLTWQAVLETSPIVAQHDGRTLQWDEPLRLNSSGPLSVSSVSLSQATLSGDFGRVTAAPASADTVSVRGHVNMDRLWSLMSQFIDIDAPGVRGNVEMEAYVGMPTVDELHLRDVKLNADNLQLETPAISIHMNEPLLSMLEGQLLAQGTGAAVRGLVAPWFDCSFIAPESHVALQMDAAPPQRLTVVAEVKPGNTASRTNGWQVYSTTSINQARLTLDVDTDSNPGHYVIRRGRLQVPGLQADLSGTLESVGTWMTTNLVVDADYDLGILSRVLLDGSQSSVALSGRKQTQLTLQGAPVTWNGSGPSAAESFQVAGELSWDSARLDGIELGPATTAFRLNKGQLQTEPIRCSVNGGQLHAMANYDLRSGEVALGTGSRVENVVLTPEACAKWMGYVTPFLADAASVNGTISARVERFRYVMDTPQASDIAGTIHIHNASASPGQSLTQLLQAVDVLRPNRRSAVRDITFPDQQIRCELRNGIMTHDQVHLALAGYQLRTRGSVGLDQRINMTLDIPVERSDDSRAGRMVSVPVTGTIRSPSVDLGRLLQDAGSQRIQSEIDEQLGRGFNRLFDKLR